MWLNPHFVPPKNSRGTKDFFSGGIKCGFGHIY